MLLETNKEIIGAKFQKYRKMRNLTQFQLAELVGLSEKQISRIEVGQNYPTYLSFAKLIEVLDINISDFFINSDIEINKEQYDSIKIIKNSKPLEQKIYHDVIKAINNTLKKY